MTGNGELIIDTKIIDEVKNIIYYFLRGEKFLAVMCLNYLCYNPLDINCEVDFYGSLVYRDGAYGDDKKCNANINLSFYQQSLGLYCIKIFRPIEKEINRNSNSNSNSNNNSNKDSDKDIKDIKYSSGRNDILFSFYRSNITNHPTYTTKVCTKFKYKIMSTGGHSKKNDMSNDKKNDDNNGKNYGDENDDKGNNGKGDGKGNNGKENKWQTIIIPIGKENFEIPKSGADCILPLSCIHYDYYIHHTEESQSEKFYLLPGSYLIYNLLNSAGFVVTQINLVIDLNLHC